MRSWCVNFFPREQSKSKVSVAASFTTLCQKSHAGTSAISVGHAHRPLQEDADTRGHGIRQLVWLQSLPFSPVELGGHTLASGADGGLSCVVTMYLAQENPPRAGAPTITPGPRRASGAWFVPGSATNFLWDFEQALPPRLWGETEPAWPLGFPKLGPVPAGKLAWG